MSNHSIPFDAEQSLIRRADSRGYLECPACSERRYIGQEIITLATAQGIAGASEVFPRHIPCDTAMKLVVFPDGIPNPLTPADLCNVFFSVQDANGQWGVINASSATDEQFTAWAKSRVKVLQGDDGSPWSPEERAEFCDRLWLIGALQLHKE